MSAVFCSTRTTWHHRVRPDIHAHRSKIPVRADFVEKIVGFDVGRLGNVLILLDDRCLVLFLADGGHQRLEFCQFPEVLGGGSERKFVLDAAWAA